ncbi:MAG: type II secretion system protein GspG [Pseudomonadota bacterium]|nr:type II secretion system protein GspG [Pseudomonadota bacterium]
MHTSRLSHSSLRLAALRAATRSRGGGLASRVGMSLVEIMVVIAIIGVLMTVIAVNVLGYLDDANVSATQIQIKKMEEALVVYAAKHKGKFPSTSEGLSAAKKYFPEGNVPLDQWDNAFLYFSPGTHGDHPYEIISLGKDGKEGGQDADADITSYSAVQD